MKKYRCAQCGMVNEVADNVLTFRCDMCNVKNSVINCEQVVEQSVDAFYDKSQYEDKNDSYEAGHVYENDEFVDRVEEEIKENPSSAPHQDSEEHAKEHTYQNDEFVDRVQEEQENVQTDSVKKDDYNGITEKKSGGSGVSPQMKSSLVSIIFILVIIAFFILFIFL